MREQGYAITIKAWIPTSKTDFDQQMAVASAMKKAAQKVVASKKNGRKQSSKSL